MKLYKKIWSKHTTVFSSASEKWQSNIIWLEWKSWLFFSSSLAKFYWISLQREQNRSFNIHQGHSVSCSTQLSIEFQLLIITKICGKGLSRYKTHRCCTFKNVNSCNCWHFRIYEQDKFHSTSSWAWTKFITCVIELKQGRSHKPNLDYLKLFWQRNHRIIVWNEHIYQFKNCEIFKFSTFFSF